MKIDFYTKAVVTVIAALMLWNTILRPAEASDATLNEVSDHVANVGSADDDKKGNVDNLQKSVSDVASDVTDLKSQ